SSLAASGGRARGARTPEPGSCPTSSSSTAAKGSWRWRSPPRATSGSTPAPVSGCRSSRWPRSATWRSKKDSKKGSRKDSKKGSRKDSKKGSRRGCPSARPRALRPRPRRRRRRAARARAARARAGQEGRARRRRRDEARSRVSPPRQGRHPNPQQQRRDVHPAAAPRRGPPLRYQLPPQPPPEADAPLRPLRYPRHRPRPPASAPPPLRQRQTRPRGDRRRAGGRPWNDPRDRGGGLLPLGQAADRAAGPGGRARDLRGASHRRRVHRFGRRGGGDDVRWAGRRPPSVLTCLVDFGNVRQSQGSAGGQTVLRRSVGAPLSIAPRDAADGGGHTNLQPHAFGHIQIAALMTYVILASTSFSRALGAGRKGRESGLAFIGRAVWDGSALLPVF